jgi:hypothetical protein
MNKFLYEFSIPQEYEEKVTEIKEENGEKVEITKTIKKTKDVKFAVLEPRRRLIEAGEIFYAKKISEYVKMDLVPHSLVTKRYLNDGGPLSEPEKERIESLKTEARELQVKLVAIDGTDAEKEKTKNDILFRLQEINSENNEIRNSFSEIFENTVESKARTKAVEWWVLHLAYIDDNGYKPFFGNGSHEDKLVKYDEYEEKNDSFYNEAIKRLSYLIAFWVGSGMRNMSQEEFKGIENLYIDNLSNYKISDLKPEIKIEEAN